MKPCNKRKGKTESWNKENKGFHKRVSVEKVLDLGFYGGIKVIRSGLYDGDRVQNYFIFISILKLIKTILKLEDKLKKEIGNDMAADVALHERSNIKWYALVFGII